METVTDNDETSGYEHANILRCALQDTSDCDGQHCLSDDRFV